MFAIMGSGKVGNVALDQAPIGAAPARRRARRALPGALGLALGLALASTGARGDDPAAASAPIGAASAAPAPSAPATAVSAAPAAGSASAAPASSAAPVASAPAASAPAAVTSAAPPSSAEPLAAAPAAPSGVSVRYEIVPEGAVAALRLERREGEREPWMAVCTGACTDRVPQSGQYRVAGEGMPPSEPFTLVAKGGEVALRIKPGSEAKRHAGIVVLGAGGVLAVSGIVTMAVAASPGSTFPADGTTSDRNANALSIGTLLTVAGIASGLTGASWAFSASLTRVGGDMAFVPERSSEPGAPAGAPAQPGAREGAGQRALATPSTVAVPLLSGAF